MAESFVASDFVLNKINELTAIRKRLVVCEIGCGEGTTSLKIVSQLRDADTFYFSVNEHLARAALADAALKTALATVNAVTMNGIARLMQRRRNSVTFSANYRLTVKFK